MAVARRDGARSRSRSGSQASDFAVNFATLGGLGNPCKGPLRRELNCHGCCSKTMRDCHGPFWPKPTLLEARHHPISASTPISLVLQCSSVCPIQPSICPLPDMTDCASEVPEHPKAWRQRELKGKGWCLNKNGPKPTRRACAASSGAPSWLMAGPSMGKK